MEDAESISDIFQNDQIVAILVLLTHWVDFDEFCSFGRRWNVVFDRLLIYICKYCPLLR